MIRAGLIFMAVGMAALSAQPVRTAPNFQASPANQLLVAGNACGPAALMSAFRFGNENWQRPLVTLQGADDRARILSIIRQYGSRPSTSMKDHPRWSRRGVNLADLTDIANDMTRNLYLPRISSALFFADKDQSPQKFLISTHRKLEKSLARGLPPILSLRRFVYRQHQWIIVEAHFVTLIALPEKLDKNASSFPITYLDPWGGRKCQGELLVPLLQFPPGLPSNLEARLPQTPVGKKLAREGESTLTVLSAAIGLW